jgi:hypothetical protein
MVPHIKFDMYTLLKTPEDQFWNSLSLHYTLAEFLEN